MDFSELLVKHHKKLILAAKEKVAEQFNFKIKRHDTLWESAMDVLNEENRLKLCDEVMLLLLDEEFVYNWKKNNDVFNDMYEKKGSLEIFQPEKDNKVEIINFDYPFGISKRLRRILNALDGTHNIKYLQDLSQISEKKLRELRGIGEKSIKELKEILSYYSIELSNNKDIKPFEEIDDGTPCS